MRLDILSHDVIVAAGPFEEPASAGPERDSPPGSA